MIRYVAVFGRVEFFEQKIVVLHKVQIIVYAEVVILELLEAAYLVGVEVYGLPQDTLADDVSQLLEVGEFLALDCIHSLLHAIDVLDGSVVVHEYVSNVLIIVGEIQILISFHHFLRIDQLC